MAIESAAVSALMQTHIGYDKRRREHVELHDGIHGCVECVFRQAFCAYL